MNEEDIIDILENVFIFKNTNDKFTKLDLDAINGLLKLYNQEKEKNKKPEEVIDMIADDVLLNEEICDKLKGVKTDCCGDMYEGNDCCNCVREYYFNKVKENEK